MIELKIINISDDDVSKIHSVDWRVFRDVNRTNLVVESIDDTLNIKEIVFDTSTNPGETYYATVRANLKVGGMTEISNIKVYTPKRVEDNHLDEHMPTVVGMPALTVEDANNFPTILGRVNSSPFICKGEALHALTEIVVKDLDNDVVYSNLEERTNKTEFNIPEKLNHGKVYKLNVAYRATNDSLSPFGSLVVCTKAESEKIKLKCELSGFIREFNNTIRIASVENSDGYEFKIKDLDNKVLANSETSLPYFLVPKNTLTDYDKFILNVKVKLLDGTSEEVDFVFTPKTFSGTKVNLVFPYEHKIAIAPATNILNACFKGKIEQLSTGAIILPKDNSQLLRKTRYTHLNLSTDELVANFNTDTIFMDIVRAKENDEYDLSLVEDGKVIFKSLNADSVQVNRYNLDTLSSVILPIDINNEMQIPFPSGMVVTKSKVVHLSNDDYIIIMSDDSNSRLYRFNFSTRFIIEITNLLTSDSLPVCNINVNKRKEIIVTPSKLNGTTFVYYKTNPDNSWSEVSIVDPTNLSSLEDGYKETETVLLETNELLIYPTKTNRNNGFKTAILNTDSNDLRNDLIDSELLSQADYLYSDDYLDRLVITGTVKLINGRVLFLSNGESANNVDSLKTKLIEYR